MPDLPSSLDYLRLQDDLPRYPPLLQLVKVLGGTIPGPTGGYTSSSILAPLLYLGAVQQSRTDTILPRDREPCLIQDVNGFGLAPKGYYLGRLANSFNSLPVYEVAGSAVSPVFLPGLTENQYNTLITNLTQNQIEVLNNLNICQLTILLQLNISIIQNLTTNLTSTQISILVGNLTINQLTQIVNTLTIIQIQTLTNNLTAVQIQILIQVLTAQQIQVLIVNLTPQQLITITEYPPATIYTIVNILTTNNLTTLLSSSPHIPPCPVIGDQNYFPQLPVVVGTPSSTPVVPFPGYAPIGVDEGGRIVAYLNGQWTVIGGGVSVNVPLGGTPVLTAESRVYKINFTSEDFNDNATSQTRRGFYLPAMGMQFAILVVHRSKWVGAAGTVTLQIGYSGTASAYISLYQLTDNPGATVFALWPNGSASGTREAPDLRSTTAPTEIEFLVTSSIDNLKNFTNGDCDVYVLAAKAGAEASGAGGSSGSGGGVTDGNKGDITVSGEDWQINAGAVGTAEIDNLAVTEAKIGNLSVTDAKIRNSAGYSIIGRSASTTGGVADITASTVNYVFMRRGSFLEFGLIETANIDDDQVTDTKLRNSAALSVIGRSANTTGNPGDIAAANDGEVLRRSGTALGFGAVNLSSANAVSGTLPIGNGGTGASTASGARTNLGLGDLDGKSCRMRRNTAQSINSATVTKVLLNNTVHDSGSLADTVNGHITVDEDGYYVVCATFALQSELEDNEALWVAVYVNGSIMKWFGATYVATASSVTAAVSGSAVLDLNAGDDVELYCFHTEGAAVNTSTTTEYMPELSVGKILPA